MNGRSLRIELAFVGAVVTLALALRLWGIQFGLPHVYHPDEGFEIYRALRLGMGGFDLERTGKGGLYFVLFAEYGAYYVWLRLTGAAAGPADMARHFAEDPSTFWLLGRLTVAVMGAATVALVAWQARQMRGPRAAVLAGLFLAVATQHVEDSHFATVDVPMALFTFAALVWIVEDVAGRRRLNPWGFAAIAAFAALNKMPAALLFVAYFAGAYFRGGWRGPRGVLRAETLGVPLLAAFCFALGNPGVWLQPERTLELLRVAVAGSGAEGGWSDEPAANRWAFYGREFVASHGWLGVGCAVLGLLLGLKERCRGTAVHAIFLVCYLTMLSASGSAHLYYERYIIPLLPGVALLAGMGLDRAIGRLFGAGMRGHLVAGAVALLVAAAPLATSIRVSAKLARPDTRTETLEWVRANVPAGSRILLEGSAEELSQLVIPLPPSPAFVARMVEDLRARDPGKAMFWEVKGPTLPEPTYDLLTVNHLVAWAPLAEQEALGAEWVVIRRDRFDGRADPKYAREIVESRGRFYRELQSSPQWRERASFETGGVRPGYDLEVWSKVPAGPAAAAPSP